MRTYGLYVYILKYVEGTYNLYMYRVPQTLPGGFFK